jgi:hypothetical protein
VARQRAMELEPVIIELKGTARLWRAKGYGAGMGFIPKSPQLHDEMILFLR